MMPLRPFEGKFKFREKVLFLKRESPYRREFRIEETSGKLNLNVFKSPLWVLLIINHIIHNTDNTLNAEKVNDSAKLSRQSMY